MKRRIASALTLFLLCAVAVYAAISYNTGSNNGPLNASPSSPITMTFTCASAELCIASFRMAQSSTVTLTGCTSSGNTWHVISTVLNFGVNSTVQACYCYNCSSETAATLSMAYTGTAAFSGAMYDRFPGAATASDPYDTSGTQTSCGASCTTGTITPAGTGEVAYGLASCESATGSWSPGSGFTTGQATPGGNGSASYSMYELNWSAGTANATNGAGASCGLIVYLFKAPSGGGATVPPMQMTEGVGD